VRNLFSEAMAAALNAPKTALAATAAAAIILPTVSAATITTGALVSAVSIAAFLIKYRVWISERMGNYETWQTLFEMLVDRLEELTPFKRK
jgi:hypothetical protein